MTAMQPQPVATVIVTNYNYARFVADAVRSALDQTAPCQIIVVDDGSTDDSPVILESLVTRHPVVQLIQKGNGGQASAMNVGWAAVETGIVLFLDGDDRLRPGAVEAVRQAFAVDPSAVRCQFRLQWVDNEGTAIDGEFPERDRRLPVGDLRARVATTPDDIAWQPTSGNAFTAELLTELMPIPEAGYRISADHYLSNLSPLYGPVLSIEQHLGDYRIHGDNHDHRAAFDLARLRSILIRTDETRRHLIERSRSLGVADMPRSPDGFASLTTAGMRLISLRLDSSTDSDDRHPFPADRRRDLVRRGFLAALGRGDFSVARRLMGVLWVAALGVAPRTLIPRIASRVLTR